MKRTHDTFKIRSESDSVYGDKIKPIAIETLLLGMNWNLQGRQDEDVRNTAALVSPT